MQECLPCGCIPGSSYADTCHIVTGQCQCLSHISGRACDTVDAGHYLINHLTGTLLTLSTCVCWVEALGWAWKHLGGRGSIWVGVEALGWAFHNGRCGWLLVCGCL